MKRWAVFHDPLDEKFEDREAAKKYAAKRALEYRSRFVVAEITDSVEQSPSLNWINYIPD